MNRYYSNEVDSNETLPLLLLDHTQACVLTSSSESEVGIVGSCIGHLLPHSTMGIDSYCHLNQEIVCPTLIRGDNK